MAITVEIPAKPTLTVDGTTVNESMVENGDLNYTGTAIESFSGPVSLVFAHADSNAEIRYTFNERNPSLNSSLYESAVTVRENGNGFGGDNLVIKAKAHVQGVISDTARWEIRLT
tara:strand:+ start:234 stop:578 length:345 start_codon:yes stop_codon:yes gene_type:complete